MKHKISLLFCLGALGLALALVSAAAAQSGGGFDLSWSAITAGGNSSQGGIFQMAGSFGQEEAGTTLSGGAFSVMGGFWPNSSENPTIVKLVRLAAKSLSSQPVWWLVGLLGLYGLIRLARRRATPPA